VVSIALGLLGGLLASRFARPGARRATGTINLLLLSLPDLLLIFFVQWGLIKLGQATGLNLLPPYGDWRGGLTLRAAVLPVLMLSLFPAAYLARIAAAAFDGVFRTDYIRTARAKGVPDRTVTWGHAFRNAIIPILAAMPAVTGIMISNLVIVEYAMNILGVGWWMAWQVVIPAKPSIVVQYPSPNIIASVTICLAAVFVVVDTVVDLILLRLDPRVRTARQETDAELAAAVMEHGPRPSLGERLSDLWQALAETITSIRLPGRETWHRIARSYRDNLPLTLGTIIVGGLVFVAIFAPLLTARGPEEGVAMITLKDGSFKVPPFPPGTPTLPLGTDINGRDVWSRVVYGARYTLLITCLIVPLRMLIGVPLGLAAGWLRGRWESFVTWSATALGAIPAVIVQVALILAIFSPPRPGSVVNPGGNEPGPFLVLFINCLVLVIMGWPRLAETVRLMSRELAARPFVEGARAVGAGPARVMIRHILPHLGPTLAVAAAAEAAWVMMLLVHIGVFGAWLGGAGALERNRMIGQGLISRIPDWSQMLAFPVKSLWFTPWVLLAPAVAFVIAILGFNLLAEGIRRAEQRFSA